MSARGCTAVALTALAAATSVLTSCAFPYDPEHTLEKVSGDALRVGISENPPWTVWPDGAPATPTATGRSSSSRAPSRPRSDRATSSAATAARSSAS